MVNTRGGASVGNAWTAETVWRRAASRRRQVSQVCRCASSCWRAVPVSSWSRYAERSSSSGSAFMLLLQIVDRPGEQLRKHQESFLDVAPGSGNPRLHGSEGRPDDGGDLLVGQAVDIAQDQSRPQVAVEPVDAIPHDASGLARLGAFGEVGTRPAEAGDRRL